MSSSGSPTETLSVGALVEALRDALSRSFPGELWVEGEIHDLRRPGSGHVYFTLVDADGDTARLPVMLHARDKVRVNRLLTRGGGAVRMTDGTHVRIRVRVDLYAPQGQLQLRMRSIDPGFTLGQLAVARAELIATLRTEGLFDRQRALALPELPLQILVVTSAAGDARHDIERTLISSGFTFELVLADVRVQGDTAVTTIVDAISWAQWQSVDVIVLARGGGSAADLAVFDDERLARAIASTATPVITGIGHEQDRSVADEVAHVAARTPTAAAQVLVDTVAEAWARASNAGHRIATSADARLAHAAERLDEIEGRTHRVASSAAALELQRLTTIGREIRHASARGLRHATETIDRLDGRILTAARRTADRSDTELTAVQDRLRRAFEQTLAARAAHLDVLEARRNAVDPARLLARGWSVTTDEQGAVVRSVGDVDRGVTITTRLVDGALTSTVDASMRSGDAAADR